MASPVPVPLERSKTGGADPASIRSLTSSIYRDHVPPIANKTTGGRIQCQSQQWTPLTEYRRHSARPDLLLGRLSLIDMMEEPNPRRLGIWSSLPVHQSSAFRPVLAEWTKPYLGWRKPVQRVWYFFCNSTITWELKEKPAYESPVDRFRQANIRPKPD